MFSFSVSFFFLFLVVTTQQQSIIDCIPTANMLDACGKGLPSGILEGNTDLQGDFDECVNEDGVYTLSIGSFNISSALLGSTLPPLLRLRWGLCFPPQCDVETFKDAGGFEDLSFALNGGAITLSPSDTTEYTVDLDQELTWSAILFISFSGVLLTIIAVSSVYDLFLEIRQEEIENSNRIEELEEEGEDISLDGDPFSSKKSDETLSLIPEQAAGEQEGKKEERNSSPPFWVMFFGSFSLLQNFRQFLKIDPRPSTSALDGMRVFSILWIVLCHGGSTIIRTPYTITNPIDVFTEMTEEWHLRYIINGTFAVDSFFVIGGFLMGLLLLKALNRPPRFALAHNPAYICFHRYWRISPIFYFILFFCATTFDYLLYGPSCAVPNPTVSIEGCSEKGWINALYIQNLYPRDSPPPCMRWAWYLAVDLQVYLLTVPIVFLFHYRRLFGLVGLGLLAVACYSTTAILVGVYDYPIGGGDISYNRNIYQSPWARSGPWLIGLALGFYCHVLSKPRVLKFWQRWILILLGLVLMGIPIFTKSYSSFASDQQEEGLFVSILYNTFGRSVYGVGVAIFLWLFYTGNGGWVNSFLSITLFRLLGKLTYSVYLTHLLVYHVYFVSFRHVPFFSIPMLYVSTVVVGFFSFVVSFLLYLCVELPFANLEKVVIVYFSARSSRSQL